MRCTPARNNKAKAVAADLLLSASLTGPKRRSALCSNARPAKVQPMVPLRKAHTGLGMPALMSDCAPMMLRVRPAQLTTMRVVALGANERARSTNSPPGTLMEPGMLMVWYSSNRRASSTTMSEPRSSSALTSCAEKEGVLRCDSTNSPKALLGTLTSRNNSPPPAAQPAKPFSNTLTCEYPNRSNTATARTAKPSPLSINTMGVFKRGMRVSASHSMRP